MRRLLAVSVLVVITGCGATGPLAPDRPAVSSANAAATASHELSGSEAIRPAAPHILAALPIRISYGVRGTGATYARFFLGYEGLPIVDALLRGHTQRTFVINQGDPAFSGIVERLTNGVDDPIEMWAQLLPPAIGENPGSTTTERNLFGAFNLANATITQLKLTIDQFSIVSPGTNPAGDNIWTDFNLFATLYVEGK